MQGKTTYGFLGFVAGLAVVFAAVATVSMMKSSRNVEGFDVLTTGKKLYSQYDEELIIRDFFKDRRGGVFVDVGCYHWELISTTNYLEKHLGWSGIAIDAQKAFEPGWKANRPRSKFYAYAVTDRSGKSVTFYLADGISSTEIENIEKWQKVQEFEPKKTKVPTITLNDLLAKNGVERIDFLSMAINEGEPAALAGFDIKRYKPELVLIEANTRVQEPIARYFADNGYERIDKYLKYDTRNWYFTPRAVSE